VEKEIIGKMRFERENGRDSGRKKNVRKKFRKITI
jgi:hypothetical protein